MTNMETIYELKKLERQGILREKCPDPKYWSWMVIRPADLPEKFRLEFNKTREIRFYW